MRDLYIGLMSGTSADGIDAALVAFGDTRPAVLATYYTPYSPELREKILGLCQKGDNEIQRLGELDIILGKAFALAANQLIANQSLLPQDIKAIGSHGQTVRHHPHHPHRFTIQIGDPNTIAAETGITTVADFRRKDIAHGGQGAPLVPAFHHCMLSSGKLNRAVVNIGGISNVTLLPKNTPDTILGFDVGPGNVLMDAWIHLHLQETHDNHGAWGAQGRMDPELLELFLSDEFFRLPPPKSTGREYFNYAWLNKQLLLLNKKIPPADIQATLAELTARCIIDSIRKHMSNGEILICGGGAHNAFLMSRLGKLATPDFSVHSTQKYGLDPDWVEAMAFAWLARQTLNRQPGNLPSVTGAHKATILGGVYYANV